jgi:hypothetical protein
MYGFFGTAAAVTFALMLASTVLRHLAFVPVLWPNRPGYGNSAPV